MYVLPVVLPRLRESTHTQSASLSCSTDAFPIPTKCSVSGNVPAPYKAPPPPEYSRQPLQDAEIGVYVIVGVFAGGAILFMCKYILRCHSPSPSPFPPSLTHSSTMHETKTCMLLRYSYTLKKNPKTPGPTSLTGRS